MIVKMIRQIVAIQIVYVIREYVYESGVLPLKIISAELDFFSFAASADFAFMLEHVVSPKDSQGLGLA